ncbi:MAG: glycosyltransferase family 4 protein [Alphaproteobacteria bacterium]
MRQSQPTILQVLPALGSATGAAGGVERGTVDVAKALVAAGWNAIVASEGGPLARELDRVGAKHVTLPLASKNPFVMRANIGRLRETIAAEGVDIVHARSRAPAWSAERAAKKEGAHFMTTFHGVYGAASPLKRAYNAVMTRGERVIAISDFIADHMRAVYKIDEARVRVIHRGVEIAHFDPMRVSQERVIQLAAGWRLPEDRRIVMLPARLSRWKGQDLLLEAMAKLGRRDLFALLVGVGSGSESLRAELEAQILRLRLGDSVRLIDDCRDMPAAYMLADVVVAPSTQPEAFGRTVTEAQAMGRPVVAADHGGARETVIDGVTGWLAAPGDPDDWAAAIDHAVSLSPAAREELSRAAIANVRGRFTNEVMCARTLDVYRELVG